MSDETTNYPFDTDQLQKGDLIPIEVIERAYSVVRDTQAYDFAALRAKDYVVRRFAERGEVVTVAQRGGVLNILTDTEQVSYNAARFRQGIFEAQRAQTRMLGADRSKIDPSAIDAHDRRLEVQGRVLAAVSREVKLFTPTPTKRATPALGAEETKPD